MSPSEDSLVIEQLYSLYEQSMFFEARAILHDEQLSEDAVHEAFLRLIRKRERIVDPTSPKTRAYVRKTLRSSAIDIYRKNKRDRENCCSYEESEDVIGETGDVFEDTVCLVDDLPNKYAKVVRCIALHKLSVREASAVLGVSEACVRKRYQRARKMLRDMIDAKSENSVSVR